ncbi:protein FAM205A [Tachyglossus aculeatus]|uniref:protein FAM205A n=1 Tax=Tachyglossus aculeatus TaxID=9261 RepID=UPI0018F7CEC8|nr:protein FAM205A [Tachyglossus aculeatus]
MWDILEAILIPIVAILWTLEWPCSDGGFVLLFLVVLFWQVQRGRIGLWGKQDEIHSLRDQHPAHIPVHRTASSQSLHFLKDAPDNTSNKVWRLCQEHAKDQAEVLRVLTRCLESENHHFQKHGSRLNASKSAHCTCSSRIPILPLEELPATLQLEEKSRQYREPGFPHSGHARSESPKEEVHIDREHASFKLRTAPEASPTETVSLFQPPLLSPKTYGLLESHLKRIHHFQKWGLPNRVENSQSPRVPATPAHPVPLQREPKESASPTQGQDDPERRSLEEETETGPSHDPRIQPTPDSVAGSKTSPRPAEATAASQHRKLISIDTGDLAFVPSDAKELLEGNIRKMIVQHRWGLPKRIMEARRQFSQPKGGRNAQEKHKSPGSSSRQSSVHQVSSYTGLALPEDSGGEVSEGTGAAVRVLMPEDSRRLKTLNRGKEALEGHMAQKSHQLRQGEIPSVVHRGQDDTNTSPPLAPLPLPGPQALSGSGNLAPILASSPTPGSLETGPRKPEQRFTSSLMLRLKPRPREEQFLVKTLGLSEESVKNLESVLKQKYLDFVTGFCLLYNMAMSSMVPSAVLARMPVSTDHKHCPEHTATDEPEGEKSEEPKLSPTAACQEASLGSEDRCQAEEVRDQRPASPTAPVSGQESKKPVQLSVCSSKTSLCPPRAAGDSGAPAGIQERKNNAGQGRDRAPVSALAARDVASTRSRGPQVPTSGPVRVSRGCQTLPRAVISDKLKMWFGTIGRGRQADISARAQLTTASGELKKKSSTSLGTPKPLFPQGPSTLQPGFSTLLTRGPLPKQPQTSSSGYLHKIGPKRPGAP